MVETIENSLSKILQKNVTLKLGNKVLKNGKLILFSVKSFYINLTLNSNNAIKNIELPYPFDILESNTGIRFIYSIEKIINANSEIKEKIKLIKKKKSNKFYDSVLHIMVHEDIISEG